MGRERGVGTHVLLQALADALTDGSRGLAIHLFVIVVDSAAVHCEFLRRLLNELCRSSHQGVICFLHRSRTSLATQPWRHGPLVPLATQKKAPAQFGRGSV